MAKNKHNPLKAYFESQKKKALPKPKLQEIKVEQAEPIRQALKLSSAIILLYESLYQQISLKTHYRFLPNRTDKLLICKFIRWIRVNKKTHANVDFLIAYFEFQFSHYEGVQTSYGKNSIMFNWIIGPLAIKRFEQRKVSQRWLVRLKNKNIKLNLKKVLQNFDKVKKPYVNQIYPYEEQEKLRFYNTPKGFVYCLNTTTLYNPISEVCSKCKNRTDCIKTLKSEFPKLFELRKCHQEPVTN